MLKIFVYIKIHPFLKITWKLYARALGACWVFAKCANFREIDWNWRRSVCLCKLHSQFLLPYWFNIMSYTIEQNHPRHSQQTNFEKRFEFQFQAIWILFAVENLVYLNYLHKYANLSQYEFVFGRHFDWPHSILLLIKFDTKISTLKIHSNRNVHTRNLNLILCWKIALLYRMSVVCLPIRMKPLFCDSG